MAFNIQSFLNLSLIFCLFTFIKLSVSWPSKMHTSNKRCAVKKPTFKPRAYIHNGEIIQDLPFVVALGGVITVDDDNEDPVRTRISCTGAILGAFWVVTVNDCFIGLQDEFVIAGTHIKYPENMQHIFFILEEIPHEDYNRNGNLEHNLALVRTHEPFSNLITTNKICLTYETPSYKTAIFAAFGDVFPGVDTEFLRHAIITNVDSMCMEQFGLAFDIFTQTCGILNDTMLAKYDVGGTLFGQLLAQDVLIGLASWALHVNNDWGSPGPIVFTSTSAYIDWIENKTGIELCTLSCPDVD